APAQALSQTGARASCAFFLPVRSQSTFRPQLPAVMVARAYLHDMANRVGIGKAHLAEILGTTEPWLLDKYQQFSTDLCSEMPRCGALSCGPKSLGARLDGRAVELRHARRRRSHTRRE